MKLLPLPVLKTCPCVGVSLCSLYVPSDFDGRTGSDESPAVCGFFQGALVLATLVRNGARDGARAWHEWQPLPWSDGTHCLGEE